MSVIKVTFQCVYVLEVNVYTHWNNTLFSHWNDIFGVILGGVLGHALCTGLAVIAGAIVATKISVRAVTFIGALVFIALAFASLFLFEEFSP
jgi:putative Ca2+/H+ antiporter (TMEM165/GDT1 family)